MLKLRIMILISFMHFSGNIYAGEEMIFQQDSIGKLLLHISSSRAQSDGRIIQTDLLGNMLYHKQQYKIKDGNLYETDSIGNILYHKPHAVLMKME